MSNILLNKNTPPPIWPPIDAVRYALKQFDRGMLTSPDGKSVDVNLSAIAELIANPQMIEVAECFSNLSKKLHEK